MAKPNLSAHFDSSEFACKCSRHPVPEKVPVSPKLVKQLEMLRAMVSSHLNKDTPLVITCGHRCPEHNKEVKGVSGSAHLNDNPVIACDIRNPIHGQGGLETFFEYAKKAGFVRRGIYPRKDPDKEFIHVDVSTTLPQTKWEG